MAVTFAPSRFATRPEQVARMMRLLAAWLPHGPFTFVEIGCGGGDQLLALAAVYPQAQFLGVDVSPDNIAAAERARAAHAAAARMRFIAGDYRRVQLPPADVIYSYSTLYAVDEPAERLFGKVAAELRPGGLFVNVMPAAGLSGCARNLLRRMLRRWRGRRLDALALALARRLYRGRMDEALLRQRLPYLYVIAHHFQGRRLDRLLANHCGLQRVAAQAEPRDSVWKMPHSLAVYRKSTVDAAAPKS